MSPVQRMLAPLQQRIMLMLGRALLTVVNDDAGLQRVQVALLSKETRDDVERFQQYGFTSHPHAGAEAAVVFLGGNRDHPIVLAIDDRRYRVQGLAAGEVAIYTDEDQEDGGHRIVFRRGQEIEINAGKKFTVNVGGGASVLTMTPEGTTLATPDFEATQS
jgi:phage baseplate assembly protein V